MKRLSTLMVWMFTALVALPGQTGTLTGIVTDRDNGDPLISATVKATDKGAITDFDGKYTLKLPPGAYTIEYTYVGYASVEREVTVKAGETLEIDIQLALESTLLKTATVTSGKYEKALGEVTVSLEVIKPQLVESINTTSVTQVLDKVPGVNMVGGQANIRGGSGYSYGAGSRVLLLVNDVPILQADAGYPQWVDVPVENVSQIEVVKGAASALYGSSALNGIINIRTDYAKQKPEFKAALFYTNYFSPKDKTKKWWDGQPFETGGSFSYKRKFGKFDLIMSGYALRDMSFNERDYDQYQRLTLGARYRVTDRLSLGFYSGFNSGQGTNFFFWKNAKEGAYRGDPRTWSTGDRFRYNIDPYVTYFDRSGNRHKLLGRFYSVDNSVSNDQSNASELWYSEYQFQRQMAGIDLVVTAGTVVSGNYIKAELYGDTTYSTLNLAGYMQLDKKMFDKLNLSAGFRYERNALTNPGITYFNGADSITIAPSDDVESKPVFRFGANLEVTDYTFLRASWGQGYRYPTLAEKYIVTTFGGVPISPNPELQSETGWSAELGIKQGFRVFDFDGFLDIAAFWSEYQDMMEFNFVNLFPTGFQSQNVGNTIIKGMEVTIAGQGNLFGLPTSLLTGYTYIDPKFAEFDTTPPPVGETPTDAQKNAINSSSDENILKYRSKHSFKFDMQSEWKKVSIGVGVLYNSYMEAIDAIFEALIVPGLKEYRLNNQGGNKVVNLRVAYNFDENRKVSLLFNNLLNEEYSVRPGLLEPPFHMTMRLDYKF